MLGQKSRFSCFFSLSIDCRDRLTLKIYISYSSWSLLNFFGNRLYNSEINSLLRIVISNQSFSLGVYLYGCSDQNTRFIPLLSQQSKCSEESCNTALHIKREHKVVLFLEKKSFDNLCNCHLKRKWQWLTGRQTSWTTTSWLAVCTTITWEQKLCWFWQQKEWKKKRVDKRKESKAKLNIGDYIRLYEIESSRMYKATVIIVKTKQVWVTLSTTASLENKIKWQGMGVIEEEFCWKEKDKDINES